ncbi:MAG: hypothetical protein ACYTEQ_27880, partial [Planctomycetota bacterium]
MTAKSTHCSKCGQFLMDGNRRKGLCRPCYRAADNERTQRRRKAKRREHKKLARQGYLPDAGDWFKAYLRGVNHPHRMNPMQCTARIFKKHTQTNPLTYLT